MGREVGHDVQLAYPLSPASFGSATHGQFDQRNASFPALISIHQPATAELAPLALRHRHHAASTGYHPSSFPTMERIHATVPRCGGREWRVYQTERNVL